MIANNLGVTPSSLNTYAGPVTYEITFSPKHYIPIGGLLVVTIPISTIAIFSSSLVTTQCYFKIDSGTTITLSAVALNAATGVITISDAFSSSAFTPPGSGNSIITLILNGLRNPRTLA